MRADRKGQIDWDCVKENKYNLKTKELQVTIDYATGKVVECEEDNSKYDNNKHDNDSKHDNDRRGDDKKDYKKDDREFYNGH